MEKKNKIAFCFLTYQDIIRVDIWSLFFKNIDPQKYIIYIHPKLEINIENYSFPLKIIKNKIETRSKSDISIVRATLQLLKESYFDNDIIPTHYIFLSQSCIPLYNFETLYNVVTQTDKSILSFIQNNQKERFFQLPNIIQSMIQYSDFVKQQPNMILIKEDVELFIQNNFTPFFSNMECPDEHYFINILLYIFKKNIIKQQTHFCNPSLHKTQALDFYRVEKNFIESIRSKLFLFMRKVTEQSYIDIEYLLERNISSS
jgi:hypothetical protein